MAKKSPKTKIRYGAPLKLKPSRVHKSKKIYNRKNKKSRLIKSTEDPRFV